MRFKSILFSMIGLASCLPMVGQVKEQPFKVNTTELTQELQRFTRGDGFKLIWWIPNEYWYASSARPGDMDTLVKALDPYILVGVIDGTVSRLGSFTYKPEDETRKSVKIFDGSGNSYSPLDAKSVSGDVNNVIATLRPILTNAMGEMGKNFIFLVFPKKGIDGKPIVTVAEPGRFHVAHTGEDFYFRLPLAALSPKLKCKVDSELLPSNFVYCPYHGTALAHQGMPGDTK